MLINVAVFFLCLNEKLGESHALLSNSAQISNALDIYVNYPKNI